MSTPAKPLTVQVQSAVARTSPMVSKLAARTKSTLELDNPWGRFLLHGEIDSLKTTTAHLFGTPEQTRTILTRNEDQMIPIENYGYKYLKVDTGDEFTEALSHCEHIWPDWAKHPEPVLIIDDLVRAKDFVVNSSKSYVDGSGNVKEYKDTRKIYGNALAEFDAVFTLANRKNMHIILVCTSKVTEGKISLEETVAPDLPPGIGNFVMSDYSFIFYLDKKKPADRRMLTSMTSEAVTELNEKGQPITYQRYYFARNKLPKDVLDKKPLALYEPADLRKVWEKVKAAKKVTVGT